MEQIIKCPHCGGNKCIETATNTYKCRYCGTTFTTPDAPHHSAENYNGPTYQQPAEVYEKQTVIYEKPAKNKIVAGILAIVLGGFGVHQFYLGHIGRGIIYLIFCWAWIPSIIGFIEGIIYLCMSDEEFNRKYNR